MNDKQCHNCIQVVHACPQNNYSIVYLSVSFGGVNSLELSFQPKSKTGSEVFLESGPLLSIFFGDFIKNWGKVGEVGFFESEVGAIFC